VRAVVGRRDESKLLPLFPPVDKLPSYMSPELIFQWILPAGLVAILFWIFYQKLDI
jgi:hypothetical protein